MNINDLYRLLDLGIGMARGLFIGWVWGAVSENYRLSKNISEAEKLLAKAKARTAYDAEIKSIFGTKQ